MNDLEDRCEHKLLARTTTQYIAGKKVVTGSCLDCNSSVVVDYKYNSVDEFFYRKKDIFTKRSE